MKHVIHTPTEQYGYVETEIEGIVDDSPYADSPLVREHQALVATIKGGADAVGMDTKDFNAVIDELIERQAITGDPGMVETMNAEQQTILQAIKRSQARLKNKNN